MAFVGAIQFLCADGLEPLNSHKQLQAVSRNACIAYLTVKERCLKFKNEKENCYKRHRKTDKRVESLLRENVDAPWCTYCKTLGPEFLNAAQQLAGKNSKIKLGKLDVSIYSSIAETYNIQDITALKLFKKGKIIDYNGPHTVIEIVNWVKKKSKPRVKAIYSVHAAKEALEENKMLAFGFFTNLKGNDAKIFLNVAYDFEDCAFAVTSEDSVFREYSVQDGSIVLFKKSNREQVNFEGHLVPEELIKFLYVESVPLLVELNDETRDFIFKGPMIHQLVILTPEWSEEITSIHEAARVVAKLYKGTVLFVTVNANDTSLQRVLEVLSVKSTDVPTIRMLNLETSIVKYKPDTDDLTSESIKTFIEKVLSNKTEPYLMSEDLPENWNKKPVYTLVGNNFESIAYDAGKKVLVDFYAPWCGYCRRLDPIYEEVGRRFMNDSDVVIGKIDLTVNEVRNVPIKSYPTIILFRNIDNKAIVFSKGRSVENLTNFVLSGGTS